jgi:NADH-quinone oxidoreductase subunit J
MIERIVLALFVSGALAGGVTMLLARHPMRVALALIGTMLSLGGLYALLGVHAVAVFQVLIYVGAVMVFMVFVIMLLDVRDPSFIERHSGLLLPGLLIGAALSALLGQMLVAGPDVAPDAAARADWRLQPFSAAFLERHWLLFELTSVLLLAAVVAAIAVLKTGGERDGDD